ncbi:MAG: hypothetical protein D6812_02860 [Deltaproteobacteria bacterium]|nr:MAG: hypothetical protein D6812_02860 [Deltaproteobacteria bacterium]
MKRSWTILIDDREKKPLSFPSVLPILNPSTQRLCHVSIATRKIRMETGDYALQGHEDLVLVERKASLDETAVNCLKPKRRAQFRRCLTRLRDSCQHPILLLEGTPHSLRQLRFRHTHRRSPEEARDALLHLLIEFGVELLMMPSGTIAHRRAMGEWIAATMIARALMQETIHADHPSDAQEDVPVEGDPNLRSG